MAGINDYLHIISSASWAGENFIDVRAKLFGLETITQDAIFSLPGTTKLISGEWVAEGGDQSLPEALREPRILAKKGKLTLKFTGTNISMRLGLNPSWGTGACYIDGVKPSAIPGVIAPLDVLNCDSGAHASWGNEYRDFLIADGLANTQHTLEVYCNNLAIGSGGFFVLTCCKVYAKENLTRSRDLWVLPNQTLNQPETLTFANHSGVDVKNVKVSYPNSLLDPATGASLGQLALGTIGAGQSRAVPMLPLMNGSEISGLHRVPITLEGDYPIGSANASGSFIPGAPDLRYSGNTWSSDTSFGELREYASAAGNFVAMTVNANNFTLRIQRDYGWGNLQIWKDNFSVAGCKTTSASPVVSIPAAQMANMAVGKHVTGTGVPVMATILSIDATANTITLSANATATNTNRTLEFDTYLTSVSCNDATGGGFFIDIAINGLTNATGNKIKLVCETKAVIVWAKVSWIGADPVEHRTETINYDLNYKHVPPFPVGGLRIENGQATWDPVALDAIDVSKPYDNSKVAREELVSRFPTYLVIYQPGYLETIKQYDLAVVDPFGMTRKQVRELQAMGIKVLLYVSFGEEDGTLLDKWDPNSAQVPWVGDGKGPGGYASYYMKGGYGFGEMSECEHDCQRTTGERKCAKNNPKYNTSLVRCTAACQRDWREGYLSWEKGDPCGGGYTRDNNWVRDASKACTNSKCPKYIPPNAKCTDYQQVSAWGQDFSMATTNYPDENGIWSSYYVDPVRRDNNSWFARLRDYYLPLIFKEPTPRDEVLSTVKVVVDPADLETGTIIGLEVSFAPVDEDEPMSVIDTATGYSYQRGLEWDMDYKLGVIKMHPNEDSPPVVEAQRLRVQYSTKGLGADGVFMDTVDTVDIYPDEVYQAAAASLINELKALYPNKAFCSNRGFSILDRIIHSCEYVMFETFLSEYDWENKVYFKIGPESNEWNDQITLQLMQLRQKHVFDVLALNYCSNGPEGDELREYIRKESTKRGWISWSSEIMLNKPLPNVPYEDNSGPLRTNMWKVRKLNRRK